METATNAQSAINLCGRKITHRLFLVLRGRGGGVDVVFSVGAGALVEGSGLGGGGDRFPMSKLKNVCVRQS